MLREQGGGGSVPGTRREVYEYYSLNRDQGASGGVNLRLGGVYLGLRGVYLGRKQDYASGVVEYSKDSLDPNQDWRMRLRAQSSDLIWIHSFYKYKSPFNTVRSRQSGIGRRLLDCTLIISFNTRHRKCEMLAIQLT